jgi:hypothetical protein
MSNDSTGTPPATPTTPEDRLLALMEKWGRDASAMTITMSSIRELMAANTNLQQDVKDKVKALESRCQEFNATITGMQTHCQTVWDRAEKLSGVRGFLDWMFLKAKEQPMAFALVFVTSVSMAVLAAVLGWDVPSLLAKFQ